METGSTPIHCVYRNIRFPPFRVTEKGDARGAYLYCKTETPTEAKFKLTVLNHHSDKESRCKGMRCPVDRVGDGCEDGMWWL